MVGIAFEGGAVRCAFTAGVIDALTEKGFTADMAAGTSAGAGCILKLRSKTNSSSTKMMALLKKSNCCFGIRQFFRSGQFLNLKRLSDMLRECTDVSELLKKDMHREFITACCQDGKPAYLSDDGMEGKLFTAIKASCALPIICKPIEINGKHYVDGSIVDPVPFSHLLELGCSKVIAVLTGPKGCHPTDYTPLKPLLYLLYHKKYPALYRTILDRIPCYWAQMQKLEEAEQNGQAFILRPQIKEIPLFSRKEEHIRAYYQHGLELVMQSWEKIEAWLAEEKASVLCQK